MASENEIKYTAYSSDELYAIMYRAEHNGAYVVHIRGRLCPTVNDFFREISSAMRFPDYFGWNWAAFDECITDLEWLSFSSLLLVIDNEESMFTDEKSQAETMIILIKYLQIAITDWKNQGINISVYINRPVPVDINH